MNYTKAINELENIYLEYVVENAEDRKKELPMVKKFLISFGIPSTISDDLILDKYTKFDFLAVCLIRKKTKKSPRI